MNTTISQSVATATTMVLTTSKSVGPITWDDATWILTSSFIIFTMQSGFGLLEAGCVSRRNEVNIMVKNAIDVIFGGLSYWMFGFGLSFGNMAGSNPFCGVGYFFVDSNTEDMGILYSTYVFQLSFATTATTIVSGAMAERTKLMAYIIFSFLNTLVYCIPAHWEWASTGFLRTLGVVDIAGSGAVHLVGGTSALVAAYLLKPRRGRFRPGLNPSINPLPMGNPANALVGMFMLWWGWLAFNCGSTFGISGGKWKLAAKAAVTTLNGSMGGGTVGIIMSYIVHKGRFDVGYLMNSVLGALVSITAGCAVIRPWEAIIVGVIGALCALGGQKLTELLRIDDPVGAIPVHCVNGIWGMLAVGFFADMDPIEDTTMGRQGLFRGGGFYLLGVQLLAIVVILSWSAVTSLIILLALKMTIGLRLSEEDELAGADFAEHLIGAYPSTDIDGYKSQGSVTPSRSGLLSRQNSVHTFPSCHSSTSIGQEEEHRVFRTENSKNTCNIRWDKVVPITNVTTDNNLEQANENRGHTFSA